jgi:UDPglucose 6-dehydrogenase
MGNGADTVAVLGVAFKPNTDDIRESPALDIIAAIQKAGIKVQAHDPEAMDAARAVLPDVVWCNSAYEAAKGAGVVALLTEWNAYRALDLKRVANVMAGNVLIDLRNVYKAEDIAGTGLDYRSVGRTLRA